ncbi:aldehyde dehydrogenase family protein [Cryobacterium sp. Y50]|uniref:aldehyde dehydrogenase family protein n=1 Tax=Cryobacterium sp. Y50 TaxID=2048286 RepID=UPI000CE4B084|nr:aldehyde dehydrogenase family protein [Cryobacterium sp. Y50]
MTIQETGLGTTTYAFIGGKFYRETTETYENVDPSTGLSLGDVASCGAVEVDVAVTLARKAQAAWSRTAVIDRSRLLTGLAGLIRDNSERLARMESEDTGKPLMQARADAEVCARYFEFYGHAIDSYYGQEIPLNKDFHVVAKREPFGVTGHILAWNYPMQLFARAVAPAIAVGNCSVVKPADETPRTALFLAELAQEAGFPPGVINVVTGIGSVAGAALSSHPDLDHIGFVGSTVIGTTIAHAAAERVIPTVLELGGKSAHVVFDDADLDAAAPIIVKAILQNAGQTCSAGSRLLVHKSVKDELLARVVEGMEAATLGDWKSGSDVGPLISKKQQKRVIRMVEEATGTILTGGTVPIGLGEGAYYLPTVIAGVNPNSEIAREEIFGPVLVTMEFSTDEEAVVLANGTDYALIAAIWTNNFGRAHRLADEMHAGQIYVNAFGAAGGVELPFGGFKKSGYGREKGIEALNAFTQSKTIAMKIR